MQPMNLPLQINTVHCKPPLDYELSDKNISHKYKDMNKAGLMLPKQQSNLPFGLMKEACELRLYK